MYERFFDLREKPYNLTPSSRFLYLGEAHREALSLLKYGVMERKGFVLLTGEVGTGKTTMVQAFLADLDERAHCIYLSNPLLTPQDLYNYLAFSAFKKRVFYRSKSAFILDFEGFLKERLRNQEIFILIIDEAQRLSFELLEEIRLLSNMETAEEKLINIFLVGQPELNKKLSDPKCRPLLQRISIRHHIKPLNFKDTAEYLWTRLRVAGADDPEGIFPKSVSEAIYEHSQGYPRMINVLADNVLLLGYSKGKKKITASMVKECYEDMQLKGSLFEKDQEGDRGQGRQKIVEIGRRRYRKLTHMLVLILVLAGFLAGFEMNDRGGGVISQVAALLPVGAQAWLAQVEEKATEDRKALEAEPSSDGGNKAALVDAIVDTRSEESDEEIAEEKLEVGTIDNAEAERRPDDKVAMAEKSVAVKGVETVEVLKDKEHWKSITVERGDTLIGLALKHYGRADRGVLELLQERNPEIKNIDRIEVGQRISIPTLSTVGEAKTFTVHVASFKPFEIAQALFFRLKQDGFEVYLMPAYTPEKGKFHRITLGSFKSRIESDAYAAEILKMGIVDYAETIRLEAK